MAQGLALNSCWDKIFSLSSSMEMPVLCQKLFCSALQAAVKLSCRLLQKGVNSGEKKNSSLLCIASPGSSTCPWEGVCS